MHFHYHYRLFCTVVGSLMIAALLVPTAFVSSASAQSGLSDATGLKRTDWVTNQGAPQPPDLTVDQFDSSLGTLLSVEITASGTVSADVTQTYNFSSTPEDFEAKDDVTLCFDLASAGFTAFGTCTGGATPAHLMVDVATAEFFADVAPGQSEASAQPVIASASASTTLTGADVAPFNGPGTVDFRVATETVTTNTGGGGNVTASFETFAEAEIAVAYTYANVDIEKATNGQDADTTPVALDAGTQVTWTYVVTNTGNVTLTDLEVVDDPEGAICAVPSLAPQQSHVCEVDGPLASLASYTNSATVTGNPVGHPDVEVSDEDPSGYTTTAPTPTATATPIPTATTVPPTPTPQPTAAPTGTAVPPTATAVPPTPTAVPPGATAVPTVAPTTTPIPTAQPVYENPSVDIELATNGEDADTPNGPQITDGGAITWTYVVTNDGTVDLFNVVVTDEDGNVVCTVPTLLVAHSFDCVVNGTASCSTGDPLKTSTVRARSEFGLYVSDTDPTHHNVACAQAAPAADEVLSAIVTPTAVTIPVSNAASSPAQPDEVLALTGDSGNGPATVALVASGLGLIALSASEALRRRHGASDV